MFLTSYILKLRSRQDTVWRRTQRTRVNRGEVLQRRRNGRRGGCRRRRCERKRQLRRLETTAWLGCRWWWWLWWLWYFGAVYVPFSALRCGSIVLRVLGKSVA